MKKDLPQVVATTSNEKTVSEDKTGLLNIEDPDEDDLDDLDGTGFLKLGMSKADYELRLAR